MIETRGYAAASAASRLEPFRFERREPGPHDVHIEILFCGICHSDLHQVRDDWESSLYPIVPGHEIVGRVVAVGGQVTRLKAGDHAGVGCMVDSCRQCDPCRDGLEQYCEDGPTWTYNAHERGSDRLTFGGYSDHIVVDERFVVKVPAGLDPASAAPLLCAGITTYSPLRHWRVGPGDRVGVIGLGGLGHMAVKLAKALGARVTMVTTSPEKAADAERLGADEVLISRDRAAMAARVRSFRFLLDTVPNEHDLNPYAKLLALDGTLVLVGALMALAPLKGGHLIDRRRSIAGSVIGGMAETQEMVDFCARHGVVSDVEVIPIQAVNEAYERMLRRDVRYRFVIDMDSLRRAPR